MNGEQSVAVCITGWHFEEPFYAQITKLANADIFVIAHQSRATAPEYLYKYVKDDHIFFEDNLGYDWGCYQQFLEKKYWHNYHYIFFIHDDVTIKDIGFVERTIELLNANHLVIGNGRVAPKRAWVDEAPQAYAHASWKPPQNYLHDVVRGSFFATTRHGLELLQNFEVFWDPAHLTSGFGNWSTKASCAKWEHLYGENCFGFLSEEYCESEFLQEHVRGNIVNQGRSSISRSKAILVRFITALCKTYMTTYWQWQTKGKKPIYFSTLARIIQMIAGRRKSPNASKLVDTH